MISFLDRFTMPLFSLLLFLLLASCRYSDAQIANHNLESMDRATTTDLVIPAAERIAMYHPLLRGKKVAAVVNQTSTLGNTHLIDTLLSLNILVEKIFAPEHGFRGEADAGEKVTDGIDSKTGLPLISLYGKNKKPSEAQLQDIDIVVFDIQDVGVRFYTYISTLHLVMEACAELQIPIIVLDRPNPNAHYIDGPVMEEEFMSFVGMHPVPIVYGMTIGEYAKMINGEGWLEGNLTADLTVLECKNYTHDSFYSLPIKPSPNIPNDRSILLYPSLCLFEGTTVSVGRGTDKQFQIYGHPDSYVGSYMFTPKPMEGAKHPKHEGKSCKGFSLEKATIGSLRERKKLDLTHLINMKHQLEKGGNTFFNNNNFFEKLSGTANLRSQLNQGMEEDEIRATWQSDIDHFKTIRSKYLIYD